MSEQSKQVVRRVIEESFGRGNFAVLDELTEGEPAVMARQVVGMLRTAFPDLRVTIEDQIAEGDKVASRVRFTGTQTGPLHSPMGTIPPTGNQAEWSAIAINQLRDGRIVSAHPLLDTLGLLQQLGVMPAPRQSSPDQASNSEAEEPVPDGYAAP